jgi:hypothetical protein
MDGMINKGMDDQFNGWLDGWKDGWSVKKH